VGNRLKNLDGAVILATGRLKLRRFLPGDFEHFSALNADLEVMRYLGGAALTRAQSDSMLLGADRSFAKSAFGKIAVERIADGAFLGMCGLSIESWYPQDLEIGRRLARRRWGCGYASEAASAWLDYAFSVLQTPRVISVTDAPNAKSVSVMKKIGLHFDHSARMNDNGDVFDAVVYALTAAEWRTMRLKSAPTSSSGSPATSTQGQTRHSCPTH
jgi:RimJ/RimL family protein N-acetyltransferase